MAWVASAIAGGSAILGFIGSNKAAKATQNAAGQLSTELSPFNVFGPGGINTQFAGRPRSAGGQFNFSQLAGGVPFGGQPVGGQFGGGGGFAQAGGGGFRQINPGFFSGGRDGNFGGFSGFGGGSDPGFSASTGGFTGQGGFNPNMFSGGLGQIQTPTGFQNISGQTVTGGPGSEGSGFNADGSPRLSRLGAGGSGPEGQFTAADFPQQQGARRTGGFGGGGGRRFNGGFSSALQAQQANEAHAQSFQDQESNIGQNINVQLGQFEPAFGGLAQLGSQQVGRAGLGGQAPAHLQAGANQLSGAAQQGGSQFGLDVLGAGFQNDLFGGQQRTQARTLDMLRRQAQPFERRSFNDLQDNLFGTGRLGTTGGGIQTEAFARGLGQADLSRQLAAGQEGRNFMQASLGGLQGVTGLNENLRQGQFGRMGQAFGAQASLPGLGLDLQRQQLGIGLDAFGGANNLQNMGLNLGQFGLATGQAQANARIGAGSNISNLFANTAGAGAGGGFNAAADSLGAISSIFANSKKFGSG